MGAYIARCNQCDFDFCHGHSHHTGLSHCICLKCFTEFGLPTASELGPEIGEIISVLRMVKRKKRRRLKVQYIPTGITFLAEQGEEFSIGSTTSYEVHYPLESLVCPVCECKAITDDLYRFKNCPKCGVGELTFNSIIF